MASNNLMEVQLPSKGLAYDDIPSKLTIKSITQKHVPYIIDKEEFENIPIALRNVYYRPNKYNKQDTLVKKL